MHKQIFLVMVIGLLGFSSSCFAQEQPTLRDRANEYFRRYEYALSASIFEKLANATSNPRLSDLVMAGESYHKLGNYSKALEFFERASTHSEHTAEQQLKFAELLKINGHYERAKHVFQQYEKRTGKPEDVQNQIAGCDSALYWLAHPTTILVQNQKHVNTPYSEFGLAVLGGKYHFVGEPNGEMDQHAKHGWTGRPFVRIFNAQSQDKELVSAAIADYKWNQDPFHLGPLASPDNGNTIYVTHNYTGQHFENKTIEAKRVYLTHRLEIQVYERKGKDWKKTAFPYNNPQYYSVAHPTFSKNGDILFFTSDMPGGNGGLDIWYCERLADGTWGEPKNAGSAINTAGNELFPQVGADGNLYFASDGWIGMGGLDVFRAEGTIGQWTKSINLGVPVNSSWDDFSYSIVEDTETIVSGYFASNRPGGQGSDDIYRVTYEKPLPEPEPIVVLIKGTVTHKTSGEPLAYAAVEVYLDEQKILDLNANDLGQFEFSADPGKQYRIRAYKPKFISDITSVSTLAVVASDTLQTTLRLEPEYSVGKTFVLENLYYDFDKANIRPDAALILDGLVQILQENPSMKIELSSHTDSRGSDAYNLNLSQRRATSAVEYLVSKGIAKNRVIAKGYGETRLVNDCANGVPCTEEQHQANRRTEVKILEM